MGIFNWLIILPRFQMQSGKASHYPKFSKLHQFVYITEPHHQKMWMWSNTIKKMGHQPHPNIYVGIYVQLNYILSHILKTKIFDSYLVLCWMTQVTVFDFEFIISYSIVDFASLQKKLIMVIWFTRQPLRCTNIIFVFSLKVKRKTENLF